METESPFARPARRSPGSRAVEWLALVGGIVHTLVPGEEPRAATVLVREDRIVAVGAEIEIPEGARRIDLTGLHLVPGLIDGFAYHDPAHDLLYTSAGVTLLRDHGNDLGRIFDSRRPEDRDRRAGPALSIAGAVLDGVPPATSEALVVQDAHAVEHGLPRLFEEGIDFVAFHQNISLEAWRKTLELSSEAGVDVWGPVPPSVSLGEVLARGQAGILNAASLLPRGRGWAHLDPEELEPKIARLAAGDAALTPLLASAEALAREHDLEDPQLSALGPAYRALWRSFEMKRRRRQSLEAPGEAERGLERLLATVASLAQAGVRIVPGSGAPHPWLAPGLGLHRELALLQRAGLEPGRVLALATRDAAQSLGLSDERGTLEVGKIADLLAVAGDPRVDLETLARAELVLLRGRPLHRSELDSLLAERDTAKRAAPLEVDAPRHPKGTWLLSGLSRCEWVSGPLSVERWAVVRDHATKLHFVGRLALAANEGAASSELSTTQVVASGRLDSFEVALRSGVHEVRVVGKRVAGQMRVRRFVDDLPVETFAVTGELVLVDVGSMTAALVVGQLPDLGPFPVLRFHEGLETELVYWKLTRRSDRTLVLVTPDGAKEFTYDDAGAPVEVVEQRGSGATWTRTSEVERADPAGLPLAEGPEGPEGHQGNGR